MKKLIALLLAVSVLFSLALTGCKSETPDDIGDNEPAASGKDPDRLIKIGFVQRNRQHRRLGADV